MLRLIPAPLHRALYRLADRARREELSALAARRLAEIGHDPAKIDKDAGALLQGGVIVAVISSPREAHIPRWEQEFAAPCVCLSLLNAALASGWGANWLTGPLARDAAFLAEAFGCAPGETGAQPRNGSDGQSSGSS